MPTYVWYVVDETSGFLGSFSTSYGRRRPRYFSTRELAEPAVEQIARRVHQNVVAQMNDELDNPEERDYHREAEAKWWRSKPTLTTYRTATRTVYLCGDPMWDSQDRRGSYYGTIRRVRLITPDDIRPRQRRYKPDPNKTKVMA